MSWLPMTKESPILGGTDAGTDVSESPEHMLELSSRGKIFMNHSEHTRCSLGDLLWWNRDCSGLCIPYKTQNLMSLAPT